MKAGKLVDWVHKNLEKRPVLSVPNALETLENRIGDCNEHAVLLAAFARAAGIPAEDARFVLPNAAATKLVMTMNARELHHFFALRCCRRAQWEIRAMAKEMLRLARGAAPLLFADAGPGCLRGACPEGKMTCGAAAEVRKEYQELG